MKHGNKFLLMLTGVLLSSPALAHSNDISSGLLAGFVHPLTGIDHLLALILAGFFIGRNVFSRQRQVGFLLMFLLTLAMGAGAGLALGAQAWIESAILLSLPVFFALQWLKQTNIIAMILGLFMLAHGWAHGVEMSMINSSFLFGFLLSSMLAISFSIFIGMRLRSHSISHA